MSDLRYALRTLINNRGFTGVAALTLALGIGATTLVFSVMDAAILRPLPCPSPDQLVIVLESHPQRGLMAVRAANYLDWRARPKAFAGSHTQFQTSFAMIGEQGHVTGTLIERDLRQSCGRTSGKRQLERERQHAATAPVG